MERGLPIGVAPNVHVSLVLLPEECRGFVDQPRRHWRRELRLKALRAAFALRFGRELRRAAAMQVA
jgi:hypothetical protein